MLPFGTGLRRGEGKFGEERFDRNKSSTQQGAHEVEPIEMLVVWTCNP